MLGLLAVSLSAAADDANVRFKRYSLLVNDLDRSIVLYRDILGYRMKQIEEVPSSSYVFKVFDIPSTAKARSVMFDGADGSTRALWLCEVKGAPVRPPTTPHVATVVLRVDRIKDVLARAKQAGFKVIDPTDFTNDDGIGAIEGAIVDSDGHLLVLYELFEGEPKPQT
jgi:catechol 2,3-dioxygenase-like lactoylglutathione lyase family enzyme